MDNENETPVIDGAKKRKGVPNDPNFFFERSEGNRIEETKRWTRKRKSRRQ